MDKEAPGQGIGNIVSSLFGGMAGCAQVGVMIMEAASTVNFQSLRNQARAPKSDSAVMLLTVAITLLTHTLAVDVLAGVALAAILFSRKVAKVIRIESWLDTPDHSIDQVRGQLFFVSTIYFRQGFELHEHPAHVTLDMAAAHIWDQSGVAALDQLIRRLRTGGSAVEVVNLNTESLDLPARIGTAPELSDLPGPSST